MNFNINRRNFGAKTSGMFKHRLGDRSPSKTTSEHIASIRLPRFGLVVCRGMRRSAAACCACDAKCCTSAMHRVPRPPELHRRWKFKYWLAVACSPLAACACQAGEIDAGKTQRSARQGPDSGGGRCRRRFSDPSPHRPCFCQIWGRSGTALFASRHHNCTPSYTGDKRVHKLVLGVLPDADIMTFRMGVLLDTVMLTPRHHAVIVPS